MEQEKRIEVVRLRARDLKTGFGNPRKIRKEKFEELKKSMEDYGDFGLFLIDEHDNVIAGNQRLQVLLQTNPEQEILCKRLIGYTESELRSINIKDNTHAGEWDLNILAEWTADLNIDLGIDLDQDLDKKKIEDMEPIRFEKYNYVLICCDNEIDYNELIRNLGLEGKKVKVAKRRMKARAIWYKDMKCQIVPKKDGENNGK